MESNVEETLSDSKGSFLKTSVKPFCLEKTRITKPERRMLDRVICNGIVKPDDAASGCGEAKSGLLESYVFSGFA